MERTPLVIAMACWGICWTVYFAQFFGPDDLLPAPVFYIALLFSQAFLVGFAACPLYTPFPAPDPPFPAGCVGLVKGVLFLATLAHLFLNVGSLLAAKHTVLSAYFLVALNAVGYLLIGMVKTSESSLGFLVCFLTGVAWNSYKGLHSGHGDGAVYKVLVSVLSVAVVFLCGMYSRAAPDVAVVSLPEGGENKSPEEGLPAKVDGACDDSLSHPLVSDNV